MLSLEARKSRAEFISKIRHRETVQGNQVTAVSKLKLKYDFNTVMHPLIHVSASQLQLPHKIAVIHFSI